MIIIRVMGGLGNQLFQYAFYVLLQEMGKDVRLDISHYAKESESKDKRPLDLLLFQNLSLISCSEKEKLKYLDEGKTFWNKVRRKLFGSYNKALVEDRQFMPEVFDWEDGYLQGYWNSERYSGKIEELLQKKLQFPDLTGEKNRELAKELVKNESIGIHVRLGDYLLPENEKLFGGICTEEYYQSAIDYVKKTCNQPVFYLFCEDASSIHNKLIGKNVKIIDWNKGRDSIYDMYLMSLCKVNICANSTFSLWAAKLNKRTDRLRIRPEILDNQVKQDIEEVKEMQKNGWILINKSGRILD